MLLYYVACQWSVSALSYNIVYYLVLSTAQSERSPSSHYCVT